MQVLHQCEVGSKLNACVALLSFENFHRVTLERSSNGQHAIAMRHLFFRVAAIQRLHPEDGCRLVRHPVNLPRPGLDASQRYSRWKRQACHFIDQRTRSVPYLDFFGEFARGMQIREWPVQARDQDILAFGRRVHLIQQRGLPIGVTAPFALSTLASCAVA